MLQGCFQAVACDRCCFGAAQLPPSPLSLARLLPRSHHTTHNTPTTKKGSLAIGIVHHENHGSKDYWLEFRPDGANLTLHVELGTPIGAGGLGKDYFTGARVKVTGSLDPGGRTLHVGSLQDFQLGKAPMGWAYEPERRFQLLTVVINMDWCAALHAAWWQLG